MKYQFREYEELTTDFTHDLSLYLTRERAEGIDKIRNADRKMQYAFLQQTKDLLDANEDDINKAQIFTGAVILVCDEVMEEYNKRLLSFLSDETESALYLHTLDILKVQPKEFVDPKSQVACVTALMNFFETSICANGDYAEGLNKENPYLQTESASHKVFAMWDRGAKVISAAYTQMLQQAQQVTAEKEREERLAEEQERVAQEQKRLAEEQERVAQEKERAAQEKARLAQERAAQEKSAPGGGSLWDYLNPFKGGASSSNSGAASSAPSSSTTTQVFAVQDLSIQPGSASGSAQSSTIGNSHSLATAIATHGLLSSHLKSASSSTSVVPSTTPSPTDSPR